jgi:hypothetical protein
MSNAESVYKMIVLTQRIKVPGIVETMSEQVPEVRIAFAERLTGAWCPMPRIFTTGS